MHNRFSLTSCSCQPICRISVGIRRTRKERGGEGFAAIGKHQSSHPIALPLSLVLSAFRSRFTTTIATTTPTGFLFVVANISIFLVLDFNTVLFAASREPVSGISDNDVAVLAAHDRPVSQHETILRLVNRVVEFHETDAVLHPISVRNAKSPGPRTRRQPDFYIQDAC